MLAGLGAERGAAETEAEPEPQFEIEEANEEYIAVDVLFPHDTYDGVEFPHDTYGGLNHEFIVHEDEDAVSLPEETAGLAQPVEVERLDEETYRMYFRTLDLGFPEMDFEGEEVTLGLGIFPERTMPRHYWDTDTVAVDVVCPEC